MHVRAYLAMPLLAPPPPAAPKATNILRHSGLPPGPWWVAGILDSRAAASTTYVFIAMRLHVQVVLPDSSNSNYSCGASL
eukprot:CAMPEP_0182897912 /NCGR_PEP_ID=MMETSP0034_2-20130328/27177_1 /TAXON_ID=156128 /ORGANISM="Nephroselmis pyriformis, Strain CCMP717" /LENGTH=79 /DNA_ID=CAMNT_0025031853 /DNA_START=95 /DNA_END=330 /DNA_ORIENTATION=+